MELATRDDTAGGRFQSGGTVDFESEAFVHMDDLYRTAASIMRSQTEAESAVREAYVEAWTSFDRFTGTSCRAWLFRILFTVISRRQPAWFSPFELEEKMVYSTPAPEDLTDEDILGAFQRLPRQYAVLLMLADVQEFTYREIQEITGIPMGTVMSRLSNGRRLLRVQLAGGETRRVVASPEARTAGGWH